MSETEFNISAKAKFIRRDVIAALVLTLAFHASLLFFFKSDIPEPHIPTPPLPAIQVLDLNDIENPELKAELAFLADNDPSQVPAGNTESGFSYVIRGVKFRTSLPPPTRVYQSLTLPPPEIITSVKIAAAAKPIVTIRPEISATIIREREKKQPEPKYPQAKIADKIVLLEFPNEISADIKKIVQPVSIIEFDFSTGDSIPRIRVIKSCGNPKLEQLAVSTFIAHSAIEKSGKQTLTIHWRKE